MHKQLQTEVELSMDLLVPPSSCCRKPPLHRQLTSSTYNNTRNPSSLKCRPRKTVSSELQTTAGVNGSYSPSIPTHKVTVHDRFRGVVHEFLVPEVCELKLLKNLFFFLCVCLNCGKNWVIECVTKMKCRTSTYYTLQNLKISLFLSLAGTVLIVLLLAVTIGLFYLNYQ